MRDLRDQLQARGDSLAVSRLWVEGLVLHGGTSAYMREWRKAHPLNEEQRQRGNARSYAGVYLRRGKLKRQSCRDCGNAKAEMHHEDYSKPLEVEWLCRECHLAIHGTEGEP